MKECLSPNWNQWQRKEKYVSPDGFATAKLSAPTFPSPQSFPDSGPDSRIPIHGYGPDSRIPILGYGPDSRIPIHGFGPIFTDSDQIHGFMNENTVECTKI